ncbi:MAG: ABC transporter ATP-binding protein [Pseudomonadota bacterium]|nr:ABC transporter ATP-binding protein [Pseudomonadota bacterium]
MIEDGSSQKPMVLLKGVELRLDSEAGPINVLKGINLEIAAGAAVSIVGPSGSGKTSLMMLIGGLENPTAGSITIAGRSLGELNENGLARFRRDNIGIVFQNYHLVPTMSALENVAIPIELCGSKNAFERARDVLGAVGLKNRTSHYPGQLSGGEQQRVALARAMVTRPRLVLADEPTGNLDGDTGDEVMELLFSLQDHHGATLLLITHNPALAHRCGRIITLRDGLVCSDSIVK